MLLINEHAAFMGRKIGRAWPLPTRATNCICNSNLWVIEHEYLHLVENYLDTVQRVTLGNVQEGECSRHSPYQGIIKSGLYFLHYISVDPSV